MKIDLSPKATLILMAKNYRGAVKHRVAPQLVVASVVTLVTILIFFIAGALVCDSFLGNLIAGVLFWMYATVYTVPILKRIGVWFDNLTKKLAEMGED